MEEPGFEINSDSKKIGTYKALPRQTHSFYDYLNAFDVQDQVLGLYTQRYLHKHLQSKVKVFRESNLLPRYLYGSEMDDEQNKPIFQMDCELREIDTSLDQLREDNFKAMLKGKTRCSMLAGERRS